MHRSHLSLSVWFWGRLSDGDAFQRHVGAAVAERVGSYKTAWLLAMKLRRAMVAPGRSPLAGLIEVDETTIPFRIKDDPPAGGRGRSHAGKLLVAGAVEIRRGKKMRQMLGRVRLATITDYCADTLHTFMKHTIAPGSVAKTDGLASYRRAPDVTHEPYIVGPMAAHVVLPAIHRSSPI